MGRVGSIWSPVWSTCMIITPGIQKLQLTFIYYVVVGWDHNTMFLGDMIRCDGVRKGGGIFIFGDAVRKLPYECWHGAGCLNLCEMKILKIYMSFLCLLHYSKRNKVTFDKITSRPTAVVQKIVLPLLLPFSSTYHCM